MPRTLAIPELRIPLKRLEALGRGNVDRRLTSFIAGELGLAESAVLGYEIQRRSLDARKKPRLEFVYQLTVQVSDQASLAPCARAQECDEPTPTHDLARLDLHLDRPRAPLVVGTGPAGIMAAYLLALHGCKPLVIDRGFDVERRAADLETFHRSRSLNTESNYLYGEGGAGTYSDGKLYTRVKDTRMRFLLEAFVAARAPRSILYAHHPHIGSDILPHMARRLRQQIEAWGGSFRWGCNVTDIIETGGRCRGVVLAEGERIEADRVLLAVGHSARRLLRRLAERGLAHKAKGFQLGCRIEHTQELIDRAQYGCRPPAHLLGAAEYNLVSRPSDGSANTTTFCMCPGGEIIAATSDLGQLSTNGMSRYARASGYANAGLIVNQPVDRLGDGLAGFDLLDELERSCFSAGGGDYSCPAQSATAFVRREASGPLPVGSYRLGLRPGRLDRLLPPATASALAAALRFYERPIPGFLSQGCLVGLETRVSSPVRFERDEATLESSLPGLALAGEGAGYAGGIVSAGIDGLKIAERMLCGLPVD